MRKVINQNRVRKWEAVGGVCCFVAGILAGLLGSVLSASGWLLGAELHPWIHAGGTALLIVTIPLILFAGFCLDWAEREVKKPLHDPEKAERGAAALAQIAIIATVIGLALLTPAALHAQQTIFNVPTTDVLARGKVYAELDVSYKPTDSTLVSKFSSFVRRVVVGTGGGVEVGLNITGNIQPGADTSTLVPAIKWKPYQGKDNGFAKPAGSRVCCAFDAPQSFAGKLVLDDASKASAY